MPAKLRRHVATATPFAPGRPRDVMHVRRRSIARCRITRTLPCVTASSLPTSLAVLSA